MNEYDQEQDDSTDVYIPSEEEMSYYKMSDCEQQIFDIAKTLAIKDFMYEIKNGNLEHFKPHTYNMLDIAVERNVICSHTREFLYNQVRNHNSVRSESYEATQRRLQRKDSGELRLDKYLPLTIRFHWDPDNGGFVDTIWNKGISAKQMSTHPGINGLGVNRLTAMAKGEMIEYGKYQVVKNIL
ncbi:hypothetical protein PLEI_1473 [Photobacterium leiognathi lrivu.4.1]|uniref:Uncharacterized protein n=1 Tax=Photobacterium leiognathi lrivu.4.1 TaxID=1248232 RepID=A0A0U1P5H5_PHOLE|nr:hypothetical protein [Photobacterium leiognathi]GAD29820.1 hypothetical protein PLEI_1473 [Photobacterium leiognathi lrivu.4.1]